MVDGKGSKEDTVLNHAYDDLDGKFPRSYYGESAPRVSRIRCSVGNSLSVILSLGLIIRALRIMIQQGPHVLLTKIASRLKLRHQYRLYLLAHKSMEDSGNKKKEAARALRYRPKISIIVPVHDTGERWLRRCIDSVRNQAYDYWELCVVDGGSQKHHIRQVLNEYASQDNRIKINFLPENKGIAENSNEALTLATGEFIGFLDHDDELAPDALYEVVKTLNEKPDVDLVYTDEDKITRVGGRIDPHFKPDWSPDLLRSHNYITHFTVIRKKVIDKVGGFRKGYDGSQDYDLFLRVTEMSHNIAHIPKILYHWRMLLQSAASIGCAKPYAYIAAKKALEDTLGRKNIQAKVDYGITAGYYRVRYSLLGNPRVSIIIVADDNIGSLYRCVQSVVDKTQYDNYRIQIVSNSRGKLERYKFYEEVVSHEKVKLAEADGSFNFSKIKNYAVSLVDSEYIIFLDVLCEVISQTWLVAMLEHIQRKEVGVVGALLYYPNHTIYHAGMILGIDGAVGYAHRSFSKHVDGYMHRARIVQNLSAVSGTCLMTKKTMFNDVGGFDDTYERMLSDVDFCLKIRKRGCLIVYTPHAELYHHGSQRRYHRDVRSNCMESKDDVEYFQRKWKDVLAKGDPYYNPNLTLDREDFSLKI
jgi:GT2 family glycosyltransferase